MICRDKMLRRQSSFSTSFNQSMHQTLRKVLLIFSMYNPDVGIGGSCKISFIYQLMSSWVFINGMDLNFQSPYLAKWTTTTHSHQISHIALNIKDSTFIWLMAWCNIILICKLKNLDWWNFLQEWSVRGPGDSWVVPGSGRRQRRSWGTRGSGPRPSIWSSTQHET